MDLKAVEMDFVLLQLAPTVRPDALAHPREPKSTLLGGSAPCAALATVGLESGAPAPASSLSGWARPGPRRAAT